MSIGDGGTAELGPEPAAYDPAMTTAQVTHEFKAAVQALHNWVNAFLNSHIAKILQYDFKNLNLLKVAR